MKSSRASQSDALLAAPMAAPHLQRKPSRPKPLNDIGSRYCRPPSPFLSRYNTTTGRGSKSNARIYDSGYRSRSSRSSGSDTPPPVPAYPAPTSLPSSSRVTITDNQERIAGRGTKEASLSKKRSRNQSLWEVEGFEPIRSPDNELFSNIEASLSNKTNRNQSLWEIEGFEPIRSPDNELLPNMTRRNQDISTLVHFSACYHPRCDRLLCDNPLHHPQSEMSHMSHVEPLRDDYDVLSTSTAGSASFLGEAVKAVGERSDYEGSAIRRVDDPSESDDSDVVILDDEIGRALFAGVRKRRIRSPSIIVISDDGSDLEMLDAPLMTSSILDRSITDPRSFSSSVIATSETYGTPDAPTTTQDHSNLLDEPASPLSSSNDQRENVRIESHNPDQYRTPRPITLPIIESSPKTYVSSISQSDTTNQSESLVAHFKRLKGKDKLKESQTKPDASSMLHGSTTVPSKSHKGLHFGSSSSLSQFSSQAPAWANFFRREPLGAGELTIENLFNPLHGHDYPPECCIILTPLPVHPNNIVNVEIWANTFGLVEHICIPPTLPLKAIICFALEGSATTAFCSAQFDGIYRCSRAFSIKRRSQMNPSFASLLRPPIKRTRLGHFNQDLRSETMASQAAPSNLSKKKKKKKKKKKQQEEHTPVHQAESHISQLTSNTKFESEELLSTRLNLAEDQPTESPNPLLNGIDSTLERIAEGPGMAHGTTTPQSQVDAHGHPETTSLDAQPGETSADSTLRKNIIVTRADDFIRDALSTTVPLTTNDDKLSQKQARLARRIAEMRRTLLGKNKPVVIEGNGKEPDSEPSNSRAPAARVDVQPCQATTLNATDTYIELVVPPLPKVGTRQDILAAQISRIKSLMGQYKSASTSAEKKIIAKAMKTCERDYEEFVSRRINRILGGTMSEGENRASKIFIFPSFTMETLVDLSEDEN